MDEGQRASTAGGPDQRMRGKRKAISKSVRFEVFKRDNFRCQYCGATAPDVLLELDHVMPVAGGGDSEILNLLTSWPLLKEAYAADIGIENIERLVDGVASWPEYESVLTEWVDGRTKVQA